MNVCILTSHYKGPFGTRVLSVLPKFLVVALEIKRLTSNIISNIKTRETFLDGSHTQDKQCFSTPPW